MQPSTMVDQRRKEGLSRQCDNERYRHLCEWLMVVPLLDDSAN